MLHGAVAAALTPLRAGGSELDEDAVVPYVDFLAVHGLDGILALGTTGEGVLLGVRERRRLTELFLEAVKHGQAQEGKADIDLRSELVTDTAGAFAG